MRRIKAYVLLCLLVLLAMLLVGCECKHEFGAWQTKTEATCTVEGVLERFCAKCEVSETQLVAKVAHSYGSWETSVKADCTKTGEKIRICKQCNARETQTIAKTDHTYDGGKVTKEATCTRDGTKVKTCTVCNAKQTMTVSALGHKPDNDLMCTRCGEQCPLDSIMTAQDKIDSGKVYWRSGIWIEHVDSKSQFEITFTLQDKEKTTYLQVPLYVDVKIVSDNGEKLYSATRVVRKSDYNGSQAVVVIKDSQIAGGTIESGDFEIRVYSPGYFSYDTNTEHVYSDLPLKPINIILPTLPMTIHEYGYKNQIDATVIITSLTYEIKHVDSVVFYFTGEKTYDVEGKGYSRSAKVGWKLYDSEGYIVDSGIFYGPGLKMGEKFRNEEASSWDKVVPGGTYTLSIENVD